MDIGTMTQLIGSLGFPIAMCIYLMISNDKMRNVISDNTLAIVELKHVIESLKEKLNDTQV